MVAVAAWAKIARPAPALDESAARALLAEEFPDEALDELHLAADGSGALARAGDRALVVARLGDGYVARDLPWRDALAAPSRDGRLVLPLREFGAPRLALPMTAWPPQEARA